MQDCPPQLPEGGNSRSLPWAHPPERSSLTACITSAPTPPCQAAECPACWFHQLFNHLKEFDFPSFLEPSIGVLSADSVPRAGNARDMSPDPLRSSGGKGKHRSQPASRPQCHGLQAFHHGASIKAGGLTWGHTPSGATWHRTEMTEGQPPSPPDTRFPLTMLTCSRN